MSTQEPAPSPPPSFVARAATTVGSYVLERRLGAGGMGEVWLGRHVVSGGIAAVKLLSPQLAKRADAGALFAREQRAISRLAHPHIVPVFEVGERHLAMAYIDGASLARRLRAAIAPSLAFRVARQVASALAQAHARGVLHLDVKPSNILMDAAGNAYLADFGAALFFEEPSSAEPPVAGTPAYIAPERAHGLPFGVAADQYALGRTLVAALLGTERLPTWGHEGGALPESLPAEARAVILRTVAVEPADRFPDVAALEEALRACNLEGLAPNVAALQPARDAGDYEWAAHPVAVVPAAPEIARADYTLDSLERSASLPAGPLQRFRDRTGLRTTGFSLYGHTRSLGAEPGPAWLARAHHLVVLAHGYAMARDSWSDMAIAIVRDNPDTIVAAVDHSGFGDSAYLCDPPALEHVGFAPAGRMPLEWTDLLDLSSLPTVFVGHSLAATGFLLIPDAAFGAHRARIVLTPMFRSLVRGGGPLWLIDLSMRTLAPLLTPRPLYRMFVAFWLARNASMREVTSARRRATGEQACQLPLRTHLRLGAAVARIEPLRGEGLRRTYFALGASDSEATHDVCEEACQILGVRPDRFRWLASGGHFPHLESEADPEGTLRNRHELVLLVDEALDEVSATRHTSTEFAETEMATLDPGASTTAAE